MDYEGQRVRRVGPHRVLRRLGAGGMGEVYLARTPGGRLLAVKVMHARFVDVPGFRERFRTEAAAAARVSGAFTAAVVGYDADAPTPWLATVYVAAPTLSDLVTKSGPLDVPTLRRLAAGLAEALGSVHAAGVIHRDLTPGNVLMSREGPRVIDFGIARALDDQTTPGTRPGRRPIGTPGYICPERWNGEPTSEAADLFSLGAVLFYAATGEHPFGTGYPEIVQIKAEQYEPDFQTIPDPLIRRISRLCLARDPAERADVPTVLGLLAQQERQEATKRSRTLMRRRSARYVPAALILAALTALTGSRTDAVAGGVTTPHHVSAAGSPSPSSTSGTDYRWSAALTPQDMYIGLWAGKYDVVVGSAQHGLTAYNDVNGAKLWSWAPPKNGALCGMSPGTDNGLAAFEFAAPAPGTDTPVCNELQAVDVDSGGMPWAKPLNLSASPSSGTPAMDQSVDISVEDGLVSAPYLTGADAADALTPDSDILLASLMTGKTAWTTDFGQSTLPNGCVLEGHAQVRGRNVYALAACANHTRVDLLTIGGGATADIADDGALPDCSTTPDAISGARLVADSDAVLVVCTSDGVQTNLYAFTVQSNGPIRLKPSTNLLSVGFDMSSTAEPGSALLHSTTLYLSDSTDDGSGTASSKTSVIRALDLLTGAQLWSASIPGARAGIAVSADDHSVEVAAVPAGSGPATMNAYDARSGTQTASVNLNAATSSALAGLSGPGQGVPSTVTLPGSRVAVLIPGKGTLAVFPLTG